jgi:hypothetical protein
MFSFFYHRTFEVNLVNKTLQHLFRNATSEVKHDNPQ